MASYQAPHPAQIYLGTFCQLGRGNSWQKGFAQHSNFMAITKLSLEALKQASSNSLAKPIRAKNIKKASRALVVFQIDVASAAPKRVVDLAGRQLVPAGPAIVREGGAAGAEAEPVLGAVPEAALEAGQHAGLPGVAAGRAGRARPAGGQPGQGLHLAERAEQHGQGVQAVPGGHRLVAEDPQGPLRDQPAQKVGRLVPEQGPAHLPPPEHRGLRGHPASLQRVPGGQEAGLREAVPAQRRAAAQDNHNVLHPPLHGHLPGQPLPLPAQTNFRLEHGHRCIQHLRRDSQTQAVLAEGGDLRLVGAVLG